MSYQSRIREIQSAFTLGFEDRETCIAMFENLLHEHGLLPVSEQLDRTITNENFLGLLKAAKEQRGVADAQADKGLADLRQAQENLRKFTQWMEKMAQGADNRYRIADSVNRLCPVCQQPVTALFNRVQSLDHQTVPVDPPRCQPCMLKWVEERFGKPAPQKALPAAPATEDGSPVTPLRVDEKDFFAEYEKQMED